MTIPDYLHGYVLLVIGGHAALLAQGKSACPTSVNRDNLDGTFLDRKLADGWPQVPVPRRMREWCGFWLLLLWGFDEVGFFKKFSTRWPPLHQQTNSVCYGCLLMEWHFVARALTSPFFAVDIGEPNFLLQIAICCYLRPRLSYLPICAAPSAYKFNCLRVLCPDLSSTSALKFGLHCVDI